jgi:hypothetical protein
MELKVLAVGDVVGGPGMDRIRRSLRYLKRKTNADFVIINGDCEFIMELLCNCIKATEIICSFACYERKLFNFALHSANLSIHTH